MPTCVRKTNTFVSIEILRISYSEALAILYEENVFHFRGGIGLPAFKSSIPTVQWNAIRHIHISTSYAAFYDRDLHWTGYNPPRTLPNWKQICDDLAQLPNLQDLRFDITADDPNVGYSFEKNETQILLSILQPLKDIRSGTIEIELNARVPEKIWRMLGPVNFMTTFRKRPFNEKVYRSLRLHDATELEMPNPNSRYI